MNMYTTQKEEPYIGITWRVSRKEKDKHNFDSIQYLDQYCTNTNIQSNPNISYIAMRENANYSKF